MSAENELYLKIIDGTGEEAKKDRLDRATVDAAQSAFYRSHPRSSILELRRTADGSVSIIGANEAGRPIRELFRSTDLQPQANGGDSD
jgi:hypothetical protein